jgi:alginate O-acetyltransferase complex protein AlgI
LESDLAVKEEDVWRGTKLVIEGFFYKVVIADNIAQSVNFAFSSPEFNSSSLYWWYIMTLFAFQIYFDFNGYSKIAIGLLRWMGYTIPDNFNHPYLSVSLKEFWRRWHISLSSWFRDYLYIPVKESLDMKLKNDRYLGLNKRRLVFSVSIFITFLLSGLWHGAAWTFVLWAAWLALLIIAERFILLPLSFTETKAGKVLMWVLVIAEVWVGWVFFRSESVEQSIRIISAMLSFSGGWQLSLDFDQKFFFVLALLPEFIYLITRRTFSDENRFSRITEVAFYSILLLTCVFFRGPGAEFIYFQF